MIVICIRVHIGILSFSSFPLDLNRINYSSDEKKMTNLKNRKFILSFEYVGIEIQSLDLVSELHGKKLSKCRLNSSFQIVVGSPSL